MGRKKPQKRRSSEKKVKVPSAKDTREVIPQGEFISTAYALFVVEAHLISVEVCGEIRGHAERACNANSHERPVLFLVLGFMVGLFSLLFC